MKPLSHFMNFSELNFAEVELGDIPSPFGIWFQKMVRENQAQLILNILIAEDPLLMNIFKDVQISLRLLLFRQFVPHCTGVKFRLGHSF